MKETQVIARFIGANGSEGYETYRQYVLILTKGKLNNQIMICRATLIGGSANVNPVEYETFHGFLANWTDIQKVN